MSDIERICRLCLTEELGNCRESMIVLNDDAEILEIIRAITSLEVIVNEAYQYFLCVECKESLQKCQYFRERCIINDSIFRSKFSVKTDDAGYSKLLPSDIGKPCDDVNKVATAKSESTCFDDEGPFIEECLVETVEQNEANNDPYEPPTSLKIDFRDSASSAKSKSVRKKRSRVTKPESDKTNNKLPCAQCGKMIARNNINQHQLTHDPDRPKVFCSYCGKAFKDPRRMQLHINSNHTLEKKYPCETCGKVYLRPTSLKDHQLSKHTNDKKYECSECGMAFTSWAQRWHHYKKEHTTAKPFACTYCDWAFKFKGDLTLHIRKHTGEKPFKCDICGKAFNKSYNVVIHKKSHRNVLAAEGRIPSDSMVPPENPVPLVFESKPLQLEDKTAI
ncbi:zinc finger protein 43-like [Anopheles nili]|uniref:zinc finger protein 43-like n=1 Tax=Anopheles nili TaxID=185578 RepID=UPI00237A6339|nr:zinc finger protein 43-like [Anopheles nili]